MPRKNALPANLPSIVPTCQGNVALGEFIAAFRERGVFTAYDDDPAPWTPEDFKSAHYWTYDELVSTYNGFTCPNPTGLVLAIAAAVGAGVLLSRGRR